MQRVRKTHELLAWINSIVGADVQCIEDVRGGAFIVQIFHSVYPFDLSKADFVSKNEYHFERNYKLLQQVFTTYKIEKDFNIENMLAGEKRRDLYYFLMWVKLHYDTFAANTAFAAHHQGYKALEERTSAIATARKKRANTMLTANSMPDENNDDRSSTSPRSTSTRCSVYSQLSAFTSYSSRFHAKVRAKEAEVVVVPSVSRPPDVWSKLRLALREDGAVSPLVTVDVDWWALGKVPGTLRVIPRTPSSPSNFSSDSIIEQKE